MEKEYNQSLARSRDRNPPSHALPDRPDRVPDAAEVLAARLKAGPPVLLDGAMGTELEGRGMASDLPLWSCRALCDNPGIVEEIHRDYTRAGCEILTANTFRTQRRTLARAGIGPRARDLTALAVGLARNAIAQSDRRIWLAGSAPPLEDCYRPQKVPDDAALEREHQEHAENLERAGVDLIAVETQNTIREAVAAAAAARAAGLPFFVSFVCGPGARLLSEEELDQAVEAVMEYGPLCVGVNCVAPSQVASCLPVLEAATRDRNPDVVFGVYANLGSPEAAGYSEACSPEEFAALALESLSHGARLLGGCCGTTPDHMRALGQTLRQAAKASGT